MRLDILLTGKFGVCCLGCECFGVVVERLVWECYLLLLVWFLGWLYILVCLRFELFGWVCLIDLFCLLAAYVFELTFDCFTV